MTKPAPRLFRMMPEQWTPAVPLTALGGGLVPLEVAGEKLVAFRSVADAEWTVLLDRCPHRGAALSLGRVMPDGTLQCRYHGWRFGAEGRCHRVPFNELKEAALARIRATAIPSRRAAGCLWVYTGLEAPGPPVLPDTLQGPAEAFGTYQQEWQAHWTRAVENFIDFTHPPYAHRETIGAYSHDFAESGGTAHVEIEEHEWGLTMLNFMGSRRFGFRLDWYAPNMTRLHFGPGHQLHVYSIPVNATRTRVMTVRALPPGYDQGAWEARAASIDHQILDEDRQIVESQPGDVADADHELSVATDAPTIRFRQWYRDKVPGDDAQLKPVTRSTVQ